MTARMARLVSQATHTLLVFDRAHAADVVRAIRDVTYAARTRTSLVAGQLASSEGSTSKKGRTRWHCEP
jgi:hypothetical protein